MTIIIGIFSIIGLAIIMEGFKGIAEIVHGKSKCKCSCNHKDFTNQIEDLDERMSEIEDCLKED